MPRHAFRRRAPNTTKRRHPLLDLFEKFSIHTVFFVSLPLTSDHFQASMMVMFRFLSLISCHFKAGGYFFIASKKTARPGSRPCPRPFFLIQRPCSSCCTTRVVSIPFHGYIKFNRNVTCVIIYCSEGDTALLPEVEAIKLDLLCKKSASAMDLA